MLDDIRKKIDEIDNSMKPLFLERLACSRQVIEGYDEVGYTIERRRQKKRYMCQSGKRKL